MREKFGKFAAEKGWKLQRFKEGRFPGEYCDGSVQDAWLSWQAAERDTRERCAQLYERLIADHCTDFREIAERIRGKE